jgi:Flp pilus assembly protein TadD
VVTAPAAPAPVYSAPETGAGIGRWVAIGALVVVLGGAGVGVNQYLSHQKALAAAAVAAKVKQAKLAEAAAERSSAEALLRDVTRAIERFKRESLTETQVDQIKAELRTKLEQALAHADRAIGLEPENAEGWVLRVRALRISGDEDSARSAVKEALQKFPGNRGLLEQRDLL